jgi:dihydrofolate synthase/folylpolyglutamate synthase
MPSLTPEANELDSSRLDNGHRNRFSLEVMGEQITVDSPLPGRHQVRNLALAITAAEELNHCGFSVSAQDIEQGIRATSWPGRFQVIPPKDANPEIVLDVAHNPAGAWALRSALSTFYEGRPLTFVFGAMRDKAIDEIAGILFPLAERVIATQSENPRAAAPQEIADYGARTHTEILREDSVRSALERARKLAGSQGVMVITGSIYIVGEALGILTQSPVGQSV